MRHGLSDMFCAVVLVTGVGCGPARPEADDTGSSSTGGVPSTDGVNTSGAAPTSGMASTTGATSVENAAATSGIEESSSFIHPKDMPGGPCDPWSQNCPSGMKCTWYADDGGGSWNNTKCVLVVESPAQVEESCVASMGPVSGIDDCDLGLMCWEVDAENHGSCVALCHGSPEEWFCDAPNLVCSIYQYGFGLCRSGCEPQHQDCNSGDVCVGDPNGEGFLCMVDASGDKGQQHDPCMFVNECDPGLFCTEVTAGAECDQNAQGCCQPFCYPRDPDADALCGGGVRYAPRMSSRACRCRITNMSATARCRSERSHDAS